MRSHGNETKKRGLIKLATYESQLLKLNYSRLTVVKIFVAANPAGMDAMINDSVGNRNEKLNKDSHLQVEGIESLRKKERIKP